MLDNEIKDFIYSMEDCGGVVKGLGEDLYMESNELITFLEENEDVVIDLLFDDILYVLVGGIPCSIEAC